LPRSTQFLLEQTSSQYQHLRKAMGSYQLKEDPEIKFLYKTTPKRHKRDREYPQVKKFNPDGQFYFCGFFTGFNDPSARYMR
jgi:hypothetical protein